MMPGEERPCCDTCAFIRGDYDDCHCAYKLSKKLDEECNRGYCPDADVVLDIVNASSVNRGDFCGDWRWYGDE